MEFTLHPELFYPGSVVTTRFGWDKDPPGPRIHHAVDRAGGRVVAMPFDAERVEWIEADAQGNSVIRAFADEGKLELRMLHFIRGELSPAFQAILKARGPAPVGTEIGPTGNKGLSIAIGPNGTGRHVHYSLLLEPGAYDDYLDSVCPGWNADRVAEFSRLYGSPFIVERTRRGIRWMGDKALAKHDPWAGKVRVLVDTHSLFGM